MNRQWGQDGPVLLSWERPETQSPLSGLTEVSDSWGVPCLALALQSPSQKALPQGDPWQVRSHGSRRETGRLGPRGGGRGACLETQGMEGVAVT